MLEVILFFKRLIRLPYDLFAGPIKFFTSNMKESRRQQALMLGIPAIAIALIGLTVLGVSQISRKSRLESWYLGQQEKTNREKVSVRAELIKTMQEKANVSQSATKTEAGADETTLEQQEMELKKRLENLITDEQIFLRKLIDIDTNNPDYRFELAQSYAGRNKEKQLAILKKLAPDDTAVYHKAHRLMARDYYFEAQSSRIPAQRNRFFEKSLLHAEHCLQQEADDQTAKEIKARVLQDQDRISEAYEEYNELFEIEPGYYLPMVQLNLARDTPGKNQSVLDRAYGKFKAKLERNENDDTGVWVTCWDNIVRCLRINKDYEKAISELKNESNRVRDVARQSYLDDAIAEIYSEWARSEPEYRTGDLATRRESLNRLKFAHQRNDELVSALVQIAWFVNNDPELSDEARKIYDPNKDPNAHPDILSDLGAKALREKDYANAINYFDTALKKSPDSPLLLNNLAYAYLVSEEVETAEKALFLVDDAIGKMLVSGRNEQFLSSLYHTRGTALMRLSQMEEAAASFEKCLAGRTDDPDTVELLIKCYEGRIESQADVYREYLVELKAREADEETDRDN